METTKQKLLILDTNILIDYYRCDQTLIKLICTYVGQIYIASPILSEIKELSASDCDSLGVKLIEPELEEIWVASSERRGPLSFQDQLCLILAKKHSWTCVTNDKPLRRECEGEGVHIIWGIELICMLVEAGGLPKKDAKDVILRIKTNNHKYIKDSVVESAFLRLGIQ